MAYKYSHIDRKNLEWLDKDTSKSTLLSIELRSGEIRGLKDLKLHLRYPITAIAGKNGSGKSTVAAIAACAYHNRRSGFNPLKRKNPYYTFSDFFIQSPEEVPPQGISIFYEFIHNKWRRGRRFPDGIGRGWQERRKKQGGKWNNYDQRVERNVVFLGIQRVVPHSEISVSKSYRNTFTPMLEHVWEDDVRETVGRILNKDYERFWSKGHSKYTLWPASNMLPMPELRDRAARAVKDRLATAKRLRGKKLGSMGAG